MKTKTKHTPGPWEVVIGYLANEGSIFVESQGNSPWKKWVAKMMSIKTEESNDAKEIQLADARLIAAAPELLEALKTVTPLLIPGMTWSDKTAIKIKTMVLEAIAKAEGK